MVANVSTPNNSISPLKDTTAIIIHHTTIHLFHELTFYTNLQGLTKVMSDFPSMQADFSSTVTYLMGKCVACSTVDWTLG